MHAHTVDIHSALSFAERPPRVAAHLAVGERPLFTNGHSTDSNQI